jgi:glycosyltransferase involved in cell wall biosynthesis
MLMRRRLAASPVVSVVVPVYDVAEHVEACLDSIAGQPLADHEVIVVDDGSPDASVEIVEKRMRRDGRVRLLRQTNAGLGAARNAGVRLASGKYLAFVDSDDVLPADAWSSMLASLEHTGSDFAVGSAVRDDGVRRWTTPLMRLNHEVARLGTNLAQMPLILADVFAWNKLYRRAFWSEAGLSFPEGTRYEDQPALTRAFLSATSFDVLTETVYRWSVREYHSSITQRRDEIADLVDRLETKRDSARLVREGAGREVLRVFYTEVLPIDMWEYFRAVPGCGSDYWSLLVEGVREFWNDETVPFHRTGVSPQQRLMGWFVAQGRRKDLESLLDWVDANRPLPFVDGELAHPWSTEPGIPAFRAG